MRRCDGCGARWDRLTTDCDCTPETAWRELNPPSPAKPAGFERSIALTLTERELASTLRRIAA